MVVAVVSVAGDYTAVLAYNKTSMATALLLSTTIVFWCVPLAFLVFRRKITVWQGLAILLAIGGGSLLIVADGVKGNKWVGDVLALVSAICYAIATITQEYLIHSDSLHIYLFRFSATATPVGWILSGATEWKQIRDYPWDWKAGLMYALYAILLATYDFLAPYFMQFSDATTMNLSLLTANFYSLGVSILAFGQKPNWLYLVGFFCIAIAIVIFTLLGPKTPPPEEGATDTLLGGQEATPLLSANSSNTEFTDVSMQ